MSFGTRNGARSIRTRQRAGKARNQIVVKGEDQEWGSLCPGSFGCRGSAGRSLWNEPGWEKELGERVAHTGEKESSGRWCPI